MFSFGFLSVAAGSAVTPVQKVVSMLNDMLLKGKADLQAEVEIMAKYDQFVHDHQRDWTLELGNLEKSIAKQKSIAEKQDADAAECKGLIVEKQAVIEETEEELRKATKLRGREEKGYAAESLDYEESVDALERALKVLKSKEGKMERVPQAFIQELAVKVPRVLIALQQPQAKEYAYEFQGGKVVGMLEKLHEKFDSELQALNKEEANKKHAYNMLKQQLESEIENLKDAIGRLQGRIADAEAASAEAKENVASDTASETETKANLKELLVTYSMKKTTFAQNQKVREDELVALQSAIDVLAGHKDVRSASFVQVRSSNMARTTMRIKKAFSFLVNNANKPVLFGMSKKKVGKKRENSEQKRWRFFCLNYKRNSWGKSSEFFLTKIDKK